MLEVLAIKFDQCDKFRNYLCSTKNRQLIPKVADGFVEVVGMAGAKTYRVNC